MTEAKIDDGGPAHPQEYKWPEENKDMRGVSRRDWFAINAPADEINKMIAATYSYEGLKGKSGPGIAHLIVDARFVYADAMIARSKKS